MNNTNDVIFIKGKDVQKFSLWKTISFVGSYSELLKIAKTKKKVTAEDFIEYCNEEFNLNLDKEKVIEILILKNIN